MAEENNERLDELIKILRKMPYQEARWILADMEKDIQFDKNALNTILNGLFDLRMLFKDFTESGLQEILPAVPDEGLAYIIKKDAGYQTDVKRVVGKERFLKLEKCEPAQENIAKGYIMDAMHTALSEKRISYHSILLLLQTVPCTKRNYLQKEQISLQFRVLNQMYKPGDMLDVLLFSKELAGQKGQLFTLRADSGKEVQRTDFRFDKSGFYFKQLYSGIDALGFVGLSVTGRGDALHPLLAVSDTQALFTPVLNSYLYKNHIYQLKFSLQFRNNKRPGQENKIRYLVYCLHCGFPLFISSADIQGDEIEIRFPAADTEPEHSGDYYLHFFYDEHQSGITLPPLHNPMIDTHEKDSIPYSGSYLFHRTNEIFEAKRVNKLLVSGRSFLERKAQASNWPESPLTISQRKKELFIFSFLPEHSEYKVKRKKALSVQKPGQEKRIDSLYEPYGNGFRRINVAANSIFNKIQPIYKKISYIPEGREAEGKPVEVKALVAEIFTQYVLPFPYFHPAWLVLQQLGNSLFKLTPEPDADALYQQLLACRDKEQKFGLYGGQDANWKITLDLYDSLSLYFSFSKIKRSAKLIELYKNLEVTLLRKFSFIFTLKYNLKDVYKFLAYKQNQLMLREHTPYQLPAMCFHILREIAEEDELSLYRKSKKIQKPVAPKNSRSFFEKLGVVEEKTKTIYQPILAQVDRPIETLAEFGHFYLLPEFYPKTESLTAFLFFLKNFARNRLKGQIIEKPLEPSLEVEGNYPHKTFSLSKKIFNKGERGTLKWEAKTTGSYRFLFPPFIELFEDSEYIRKGSGIFIKPTLYSRQELQFRCKEKGEGSIFVLVEDENSEEGFYLWELERLAVT